MRKYQKKKDAHQLPCFGENFCDEITLPSLITVNKIKNCEKNGLPAPLNLRCWLLTNE